MFYSCFFFRSFSFISLQITFKQMERNVSIHFHSSLYPIFPLLRQTKFILFNFIHFPTFRFSVFGRQSLSPSSLIHILLSLIHTFISLSLTILFHGHHHHHPFLSPTLSTNYMCHLHTCCSCLMHFTC